MSMLFKLRHVAELVGGLAIASGDEEAQQSVSHPVIVVGDISNGEIAPLSSLKEMSIPVVDRIRDRHARVGDVLITAKGSSYKIAQVQSHSAGAVVSANLIIARPGDRILPSVLAAILSSARFETEITGLSQSRQRLLSISIKDLGELDIPVPPMSEQRRIAEFMDASREYWRAAIAAAESRRLIARAMLDKAILANTLDDEKWK